VTRCILETSDNVLEQTVNQVKVPFYSIQLDECTDTASQPHLSMFIRCVYSRGVQHFLSVGHITNFRHLAGPHEKFCFFMYTMNQSVWEKWERVGKIRVLASATLNGLAGRVVTRGPPVAHPWFIATMKHQATWCYAKFCCCMLKVKVFSNALELLQQAFNSLRKICGDLHRMVQRYVLV